MYCWWTHLHSETQKVNFHAAHIFQLLNLILLEQLQDLCRAQQIWFYDFFSSSNLNSSLPRISFSNTRNLRLWSMVSFLFLPLTCLIFFFAFETMIWNLFSKFDTFSLIGNTFGFSLELITRAFEQFCLSTVSGICSTRPLFKSNTYPIFLVF